MGDLCFGLFVAAVAVAFVSSIAGPTAAGALIAAGVAFWEVSGCERK